MNARERVLAAVKGKQPDRCPADLMLEGSTLNRLLKEFNLPNEDALCDFLQVDVQFAFPRLTRKMEFLPDGTWFDQMGQHRKMQSNEYAEYAEWASYPLADAETAEDIYAYSRFPSVEDYDWDSYRARCQQVGEKRAVKLHTGGIFEIARDMRGYEQFMVDMVCDPDIVHALMDVYCTFWCNFVEKAMSVAGDLIDIVYTYDDLATQMGLLISHDMLEEFVYPYHRKLNAVIKKYGKPILFHSCGAIQTELGSLHALPIDIFTPLQPLAKGMDHADARAQHPALCFHGAIDIQQLLPKGTAEEVRQAVKTAIQTLGPNYILCAAHFIQNDTPTENILAMYDVSIR